MPNLLLVDDNVTFARFLRVLLESKLPGVRVVAVDCLEAARSCAMTMSLDVALLDVRLPDGTGDELRDELVRTHPRIRIVMMSAEPLSASRAEGCDGVVGVLVKPFESDEVVRLVRQALPGCYGKSGSASEMDASSSDRPRAQPLLKKQLILLLSGLYDIRQTLRDQGMGEREVHAAVKEKLVPLIGVVSEMSRAIKGHPGDER